MDLSWQDDASCRNDPEPECWWPETGHTAEAERAVRVCFGCPVRNQCLEYHLAVEEVPLGIVGGLTATERKRLVSA